MGDEKIEVEWIATAQQMLSTLQKIDGRIEKTEKTMQKLTDSSKKGAEGVAGSFNKLEEELKQNEAALKRLAVGSKAFDDQKRKVDELRKSFKAAKGELGQVAGETNGLLSAGIGKVAALGAGMISFQKVVSAVVDELEKVRQLRLESANVAKTVEQALVDAAPNFAGLGPVDQVIPEAKRAIEATALAEGIDAAQLANLVGVAVSAGANDLKEAIRLSVIGTKLTAGDAAKAQTLVGGMLDIAGKGNTKNFEGAMGQLFQSMGQARATNFALFGENMGPGVAAATRDMPRMNGMSTEQAMETISVFTQIMGDQTGAKSATILNQYFARLGDFVPERSKELEDGRKVSVTQPEIDAFVNEKDYAKKKKLMQQSPGIMEQFIDTQREGNAKGTIREFIQGSERVNNWLAKAEAAVTSLDEAAKVTEGYFKQIENLSPVVQAGRGTDAVVQSVMSKAGMEGEIQSQVEKVLAQNLPGFDMIAAPSVRRAIDINEASGMSLGEAATKALETMLTKGLMGQMPNEQTAAVTRSALTQIEKLDQLIKLQEEQLALQRGQGNPNKAAAPNVRPKEAPLPAATAP